jgi:hypothetical protein
LRSGCEALPRASHGIDHRAGQLAAVLPGTGAILPSLGTILGLIDWLQWPGDSVMSDNNPPPPLVYDGLDPAPEPKSTAAEVSEAVKGTVHRIGNAIETGRKPGMPLSVLSNIAREAPLGSLLVAFLLGVAVARRR